MIYLWLSWHFPLSESWLWFTYLSLHNFLINPKQAHVILAIIEFTARLSPKTTHLLYFKVQIWHFMYVIYALLLLFST